MRGILSWLQGVPTVKFVAKQVRLLLEAEGLTAAGRVNVISVLYLLVAMTLLTVPALGLFITCVATGQLAAFTGDAKTVVRWLLIYFAGSVFTVGVCEALRASRR